MVYICTTCTVEQKAAQVHNLQTYKEDVGMAVPNTTNSMSRDGSVQERQGIKHNYSPVAYAENEILNSYCSDILTEQNSFCSVVLQF